jgi:MoxR-like ATPase
MAIKGRTQLSIHITDEHYNAFNQIKEDTGLSNAKIVEMLIDSYVSSDRTVKPLTTSTKNKPEPEPKYVTEERVKELIQEALSSYTPEETEEEKEKKKVAALVAQYTDENGNFDTEATCILYTTKSTYRR